MMKRQSSSFLGKSFLWLLALAVAALVEGFLVASTDAKETLGTIADLQQIPPNMPEAAVHVDRVVEFVNFMVGLFQLAI